jgi:tetratricopeptide (TPR) repeat protein
MSDNADSRPNPLEGPDERPPGQLPEGVDPTTVNLQDASEDLLWKVLPHVEGTRRAEALYILGSRLARNERWDQAVVCAEESIDEWESADNHSAMVHGLLASASCRAQLNDLAEALAHYERAIPLLQEYGPETELIEAHANVAMVLEEMGELEQAHSHLLAALDRAERLEEPIAAADIHENLARTARLMDADTSVVYSHLIAARQLYASAKTLDKVLQANDSLARHFDEMGEFTTSLTYLEENIHIATSLGRTETIGTAHYRYAGALRLCDRAEDAFLHINSARENLQSTGDHERVLWCDLEELWCLQRLGRRKAAADLLKRLWVTARIIGGASEVQSVATDVYVDALSRQETQERMGICQQAIAWAREHDDDARSDVLIQQFTIEMTLTLIDDSQFEAAQECLLPLAQVQAAPLSADVDALLQTARALIALSQDDAPSAAMALAGVTPDETLPPVVRARVLTARGQINEALVRGSGVADIAAAAQAWTNLGFREVVSTTLDLLAKHGK